ncbi:MAG TPA: alpha/beta hydrolase [Candidatus Dormibacteraeota bacterium]|nr:alpha/beta hydrolase [Candidatus Dormibacteraeota bacterium]
MPSVEINGGQVVYEILGPEDGDPIVLTPGGRFSKDVPGLRPLAEKLVEGGMKVLLWDRPNCGASDVQFTGRSESHMRADTLAELLKRVGMAPAVIAGGSGGARDSIITVIEHPEVATRLIVWSIVGGVYSTINLAGVYVLPNIITVKSRGIEAVLEMPEWKERIEANPRNRERILALGADGFLRVMLRWLNAYVPKPGQTIPGVEDEEFEKIQVPTLIIRGGENDLDHPKRTSFEVHCLIRGSRLVDPPWPEDAWERAVEASARGAGNIFDPWVQAAPLILDFCREGVATG